MFRGSKMAKNAGFILDFLSVESFLVPFIFENLLGTKSTLSGSKFAMPPRYERFHFIPLLHIGIWNSQKVCILTPTHLNRILVNVHKIWTNCAVITLNFSDFSMRLSHGEIFKDFLRHALTWIWWFWLERPFKLFISLTTFSKREKISKLPSSNVTS